MDTWGQSYKAIFVRPGLHVRWIVLKNVIYLQVQRIHTYPLYKTVHHLITSTKMSKKAHVESAFTYNPGLTSNSVYLTLDQRVAEKPKS